MNSAPDTKKQKILSVLPLLIIGLVCVIAIIIVHHLTKEKIKDNEERAALAILNEIITLEYDNDLFKDKIEIEVPNSINPSEKIIVHRARKNEQPIAVSLMPVISKGYNGSISLVIGISYEGALTGVRILDHSETEGFGDQAHQDKSDWILGFNGLSSSDTKEQDWAIERDGGKFDQLSGATITARSIIGSVYKTLIFYSENRDSFYADN